MKNKLISIICLLMLALSLSATTVFATDGVEINEKNFPDQIFRNYLIDYIDGTDGSSKDKVLSTDEIAKVTKLSLSNKKITNLKGIEHFTALTSLAVSNNQLTKIDLSNNTALTVLYAYDNQLTEIDLSNNTDLTSLYIENNQLTEIDLSNNTKLNELSAFDNKLTKIDVSNNTALTSLAVSNNQLTKIDLSNNTDLTSLDVRSNQLTEIDVSNNTDLTSLYIDNNQLTEIDLSNNTALTSLDVRSNQLTEIDVSNNTKLISLHIDNNIEILNISGCTALVHFYISFPELVELNISNISDVTLSTFDASNHTKLKSLDVSNNYLAELDLSNNTKLESLDVSNNDLAELKLSNNTKLEYLFANNNPLTMLDITDCTDLKKLYISNTSLTELNVSGYTNLEVLVAANNRLTKLDASDCTSLYNVELDITDESITSLLEEVNFSGCTALQYFIYPTNNKIAKLNFNDCSALGLSDFSDFSELVELNVTNNNLKTLNVSNNTKLENLNVNKNNLIKLDLSNNPNLKTVILNDEIGAQLGGLLYYVKSGDNFVVDLGAQLGLSALELANIKLADGQGATFDTTTGKVTFTSAPTTLIYTYATGAVMSTDDGVVFHSNMDVVFTVERDPNDKDPETPNTETPNTETPNTETPNTENPNTENPNTENPNTENSVETVTITGRLVDANGNPMANVVVSMFSKPVYTLTDANGYYKLENVPVGTHTLRVFATLADFEAYVADLNTGKTPSVKPLLEIANVVVSKDASENAIINTGGELYNEGNFFIQLNSDGTVNITNTNPKTGDTNNTMVFVALLAVSMVGLVVVRKSKIKIDFV